MHMKKLFALVLALLMLLGTVSGCGAKEDEQPVDDGTAEIYIYQDKYEIDAALKAACDAYTALNPNVTFVVESTSSDQFSTQLKTMFASGQGPDIFSTKGSEDLAIMVEYMENLDAQTWVANMSAAAVEAGSYEGSVYGFPIAEESYGYVYNKYLFAQAGITDVPKTLTELRAVCEKLVEAGITPFSSNYSEWYQSGMFKFSSAISRQDDPLAFIAALNDGSATMVGNEEIINLAKWIDIEIEYSKSPLNADFNTQVADFANGTCAMMLGGSWSQPALDDANPGMNVGLFPLPMSEDATESKLFTSSAPFWSVNNASEDKEEALAFLEWLSTDPEGQKYLSSEFALIPAFTNIAVDSVAIGPLGADTTTYIAAGETYGIYSSFFPQGMGGAQLFGETVNKYAAGLLSVDEFAAELQAQWESVS